MATKEWLGKVEEKCGAVVTAYTELFDQIGTMDEIPGVNEDKLEEISAVVAIKLMRMDDKISGMDDKISGILCPEPESIPVMGIVGGVQ